MVAISVNSRVSGLSAFGAILYMSKGQTFANHHFMITGKIPAEVANLLMAACDHNADHM
jgi:hypothetical protein